MRKALLTLAALGLAASAMADALPTIPLFNAAKAEMYKYVFPEATSKVETPLAGTSRSLNFSVAGDSWSGGGIGFDKQRLSAYLATGALEFYVRGGAGTDKVSVGFVQAKGMDTAKDLAYQVLLPLANYARVGATWTKVTIPLKDFPAQGSRWIESEKRTATGEFNWDRVTEFVISHEQGSAGTVNISFGNIDIAGSYNAAQVQASKPRASAASGAVLFYSAGPDSKDGGSTYGYGGATKVGDSKPGHSGSVCLRADLDTTAWSGAGMSRNPVNLSALKGGGTLTLWAKGGQGGEEIYIGMVSKSNQMTVRLSSASYLPGGLKTSWTKIQIPLKDFPADGAKWDPKANANVNAPFDWASVGEVMFDNNGPNNKNATVFVDDVEIK